MLSEFATYLRRVDPKLDRWETVVSGEPDYHVLVDAALAVMVGSRGRRVLRQVRERTGLHSRLSGAVVGDPQFDILIPITLFDRWDLASLEPRPPSFDVLAVVTTYNEVDIIEQLLSRLTRDGIRVHVIDNWSTDATPDLVGKFVADGAVTWERFPSAGTTGYFELERLLQRVEQVAADSGADWVIHHDADEIREPPWPGVALIDALWAIEQWGYNCIDHTVLNFRPVDNSWSPGADLERSFTWCEFGDTPADFLQIKAWKPQPTGVTMARSAGHEVRFKGRRVFPYKFLMRHYPIRSQEHGEQKILRDRKPRWSPDERAKGWHVHYDHYNEHTSFLWNAKDLLSWSEIDRRYFLQRLSGVGMANNPWHGEGVIVDA